MKNMKSKLVFTLLFCFVAFQESVNGRLLAIAKPRPEDAAAFARWNVASFSDGLPNEGHGIPYFYLTTLDPTASNALKDQRSSFTIREYPIGTFGEKDPENPTCARITLTGKACCRTKCYF